MTRRVIISPQVRDFIRQLAPEPRRRARRCLDALAEDRGDICSLDAELEGYCRLRVGQYRIIFRYAGEGAIYCAFMETRELVYQLFAEARRLIDLL